MQRACDSMLAAASNASIPAGTNGPHNDADTSLRNTAHWAITYARVGYLLGAPKYTDVSATLLNHIVEIVDTKASAVPRFRNSAGKDSVNGVIGMGWLLEGMGVAGRQLDHKPALRTARELAKLNPFNCQRGLWKTRDFDGQVLEIDETINHQIWYALGVAEVPEVDAEIKENLNLFGMSLANILESRGPILEHLVGDERLIRKIAKRNSYRALDIKSINRTVEAIKNPRLERIRAGHSYVRSKEIGYLVFTLHGLVRLMGRGYVSESVKRKMEASVHFTSTDEYMAAISDNPWSYNYNPPGFEYPNIAVSPSLAVDKKLRMTTARTLYAEQLARTYDNDTGTFSRVPDPATALARIYTLSLLEQNELDQLVECHN